MWRTAQGDVWWICEVRKTAVEVEHVKTVNNLSYAEAVRRVQGQRGREKQETNKLSRTEMDQTVEVIVGLTMDKMVLFMAYVINCADQVKQKTEKIKIIVRAAREVFGCQRCVLGAGQQKTRRGWKAGRVRR